MKTFDELRLSAAHRESMSKVRKGLFKKVAIVEAAAKKNDRMLGVVGYGHVVQRDERLMKRNAKRGAKGVSKVGMKPTHGPVTITKFNTAGQVVGMEVRGIK